MASPPSTKRRSAAGIARNSGESELHTAWPDVERTLKRSLRRRVDAATAEDICQDVAERLLARAAPFETVDDLVRWAQKVAQRRAIDRWRTYGRRLADEPVPDHESPLDVARLVTHRAAIDEAAQAIRSLRPEERAALLRADSPDTVDVRDARERQRDANLRERARERLRGMVHNFPAGVGARIGHWLRRRHFTGNVAVGDWGHLVAGAGIAFAILASPLGGGREPAPPRPPAGDSATASAAPRTEDAGPSSATAGPGGGERTAGADAGAERTGPLAGPEGERVVLQSVETPVSQTKVGTREPDPDDPDDDRIVCVTDDEGSRVCADDLLPAVPLP